MDEQGAQAMGEKDTVCGSRHTVQTRVGTRCMSHETLLAATDNGMIFCERSRASAEQKLHEALLSARVREWEDAVLNSKDRPVVQVSWPQLLSRAISHVLLES